jgi:hypothetical protein
MGYSVESIVCRLRTIGLSSMAPGFSHHLRYQSLNCERNLVEELTFTIRNVTRCNSCALMSIRVYQADKLRGTKTIFSRQGEDRHSSRANLYRCSFTNHKS